MPSSSTALATRIDIRQFGASGDGSSDDSRAIEAAIEEALRSGRALYIPAGNYLLSRTPGRRIAEIGGLDAIDITGRNLTIIGDGMGRTILRRRARSIQANNQSLLRFVSAGRGNVTLRDMSLDMDATRGNVTPGGNLRGNFSWQHNACAEFRPLGRTRAFETVACENIGIRNPVSDGISLRGGPDTGPGFGRFLATNIRNESWEVTDARPRVRGDITITAVCDEIAITGGRLPRLHLERDIALRTEHVSRIKIDGVTVGELLAHNPGNLTSVGGSPPRIQLIMSGGSIERRLFAGCGVFQFLGTRIVARGDAASRLTEGDFRFLNCLFLTDPSYSGSTAPESGFLTANALYPRLVSIQDGIWQSGGRSNTPKSFLYLGDNGGGARQVSVENFEHRAAGSLLLMGNDIGYEIVNVTSSYNGSHPWGVGLVFVPTYSSGGRRCCVLKGIRTGGGAVLTPPYTQPSRAGGRVTVASSGNAGQVLDISSVPYGKSARALQGSAWIVGGANACS